jgi:hypothetical protein
MKRTLWWVKFPRAENAVTYRFGVPVTEAHLRRYICNQLDLLRLPRGTEIWGG